MQLVGRKGATRRREELLYSDVGQRLGCRAHTCARSCRRPPPRVSVRLTEGGRPVRRDRPGALVQAFDRIASADPHVGARSDPCAGAATGRLRGSALGWVRPPTPSVPIVENVPLPLRHPPRSCAAGEGSADRPILCDAIAADHHEEIERNSHEETDFEPASRLSWPQELRLLQRGRIVGSIEHCPVPRRLDAIAVVDEQKTCQIVFANETVRGVINVLPGSTMRVADSSTHP